MHNRTQCAFPRKGVFLFDGGSVVNGATDDTQAAMSGQIPILIDEVGTDATESVPVVGLSDAAPLVAPAEVPEQVAVEATEPAPEAALPEGDAALPEGDAAVPAAQDTSEAEPSTSDDESTANA